MNSWTGFLTIAVITFLLTMLPALAECFEVKDILECDNSNKCPYFFEIFDGDANFRKAFNATVQSSGIKIPDWIPNARPEAATALHIV